ncbi:hypothetical protein B7494_g8467 [Chlorociboria aeruginascens]|nr:hypothetical protein B7494_g8467 [Chlorociboria aeruginascens]
MSTPYEQDIIRRNRIENGHRIFWARYDSTRLELGVDATLMTWVEQVFFRASFRVAKLLVLDLLDILKVEPAACVLPSKISTRTLSRDLDRVRIRISLNELSPLVATPLIKAMFHNQVTWDFQNDVILWNAVFDFVSFTRIAAPTPPEDDDSVWSPEGLEQIMTELSGCLYHNVKGFYERYFEGKDWSQYAQVIYDASRLRFLEECWKPWPEPSFHELLLAWFSKLQDVIGDRVGRRYYTSSEIDMFLTTVDAVPNLEYNWSHVLVVGRHREKAEKDQSITTVVQLAGYARQIFGSQPGRRFVPGFTICGTFMRLWMFDRSGAYSSEGFNILEEPERVMKVIAGYTLMTDEELGLNMSIKRDDPDGQYIITQNTKIYLDDNPIASVPVITGRGTACYRGKRSPDGEWEYVVKFSWPGEGNVREGRLLKAAKESGVTGIAQWVSHERMTVNGNPETTSYFRRDMEFGRPRYMSHREFLEDGYRSPTRVISIESSGSDSTPERTYNNRTSCCVVTSPIGRPLSTYQSVTELLETLRAALLGHRSLYEVGEILHQDVSESNIIILDAATEDDPKGLLIDLDLARGVKNRLERPRGRTGTMEFMAIGALRGETHSYRHDLESFLYVLIWVGLRYGHDTEDRQGPNRLGYYDDLIRWNRGDYEECANTKLSQMKKYSFELLIWNFRSSFRCLKPLARALRSILFPLYDGEIFTGTFDNEGEIYDKVIAVFDKAIEGVKTENEDWLAGVAVAYREEGEEGVVESSDDDEEGDGVGENSEVKEEEGDGVGENSEVKEEEEDDIAKMWGFRNGM